MIGVRREQFRIFPADLKPNTGIGIKVPFGTDNPFIVNYTTADQVKSNLFNFLMTNEGERPFNPTFGANIRSFLFEPLVDLEDFKDILSQKISSRFTNIFLKDITFDVQPDNNYLYIKITYELNKNEDSLTIQANNVE